MNKFSWWAQLLITLSMFTAFMSLLLMIGWLGGNARKDGYNKATIDWQRAAIDAGVAEMAPVDKYGKTEFRWLTGKASDSQ